MPYPGTCYPLPSLGPDHPATAYLLQRQFDPEYLAYYFGVAFCVQGPQDNAGWRSTGRLIIPIVMGGKMKSWQARYLGEGDWSRIPKYFNEPGSHKSEYVYGLDYAGQSPVVTIVEGVPSVWRLGGGTVALFGSTCSVTQLQLLLSLPARAFVIALDGRTVRASGAPASDTTVSTKRIAQLLRDAGRTVVTLSLPDGQQPDGLHLAGQFWPIVAEQALQQGVRL